MLQPSDLNQRTGSYRLGDLLMLLFDIVRTSRNVAQTQSRLEKIAHISACLKRLPPEEIEIGVNYLAGRLRQGSIGVGPSLLRSASADAAPEPAITLAEADETFSRIAGTTGSGSGSERRRLLTMLLSKATQEEQHFL
ncbi:MAG: hypothetical protein ICV75_08980, partial [Nitrospiraceae bacterium]|nr:hypothetical protein [Nitrospiraceae bacterium]